MHVFLSKLDTFGGDMLGKVYIFLLKKKEGVKEEKKKKKLKRDA